MIKAYEDGASLASLSRQTGLSIYKIKPVAKNRYWLNNINDYITNNKNNTGKLKMRNFFISNV